MFSVGAAGFRRVSTGFLRASTGFLRVFAVSRQDPAPFSKKNSKIIKTISKGVTWSCFALKGALGFQHPLQTGSVRPGASLQVPVAVKVLKN